MNFRKSVIRVVVVTLTTAAAMTPQLAATEPAHACSLSAGSGSYSYGSNLGSNSLVVCAAAGGATTSGSLASTTATTSGSTKPRVVIVPPKPTVICRIVTKAVFVGPPSYAKRYVDSPVCVSNAQLPLPAAPPAPKTLVVVKSATPAVQGANSSDQSSFSPDPIELWSTGTQAKPGESISFVARITTHLRQAVILGRPVTVRFTPVLVQWNFGAGPSSWLDIGAATQTRSFTNTGSQAVAASVRFEAAFRFAGQTSWTTQPGFLTSDDSVTVIIADPPAAATVTKPKPRVRLVVSDCLARPLALGCP